MTELKIIPIFPYVGEVVKRLQNQTLYVQVAVESDQEIKSENLIVELWSAVKDVAGKRQHGFELNFKEEKEGSLIYDLEIKLPETGYFPMHFRAREKSSEYWQWDVSPHEKSQATLWVDPSWVQESIVYNAFIRYFGAKELDGDGVIKPGQGGTFDDVKKELNKLRTMGINVLYLNPVHAIGELFKNYNPHDLLPGYLQPGCPYSIKDYKSIDPELSLDRTKVGEEEHPFAEFKRLIDYAHKLGIKVIMDMVFNHSAHDSVFQRIHPEWFLYKQDINSLEEPYLYPQDVVKGLPWGDPKHTFSPNDHGYWWGDAAQLNWNNCDQYPDFIMKNVSANKPPKNPTIKEMYEYFKNITKFWVREFGIDGFRCDVAYRVPLDFWQECIIETREVAKAAHPENGSITGDVIFIAEDYHVLLKELLDVGFTAVYGDFSNKLYSLPDLKGYLDYMYNLNGKNFPDGSNWFIFPECHDFHRNPSKIAAEFRDSHRDADLNANKSRWTITATLPGIPMIFNGFEKIEWEPANLFSYSSIDWESDKDISEHIKKVNEIRHESKALQKGNYTFIPTSEGESYEAKIFSFARVYENEIYIICVNLDIINPFGTKLYLPDSLGIDFTKEYTLEDLYGGSEFTKQGYEIDVILEAGEAHIFKVSQKT